MRLNGKVAIVTGAANGIGAAIAALFREEGATVYAVDIAADPASEVHRMDVGEPDGWQQLLTEIADRHHGVDILINNAGIVKHYEGIAEVDLDAWDEVLRVNLHGTFLGMRAVIPWMRRARRGSIVNFSSIWGIAGASGVAAYQASKGAVRTLTKNAAITYASDGIRANSVHPGLVLTPLIAAQDDAVTQTVIDATPLGRGAQPRELAYGALYLASDEASFVTGSELVIDGGYLAV